MWKDFGYGYRILDTREGRKEGRSLVGIPARAEERINYDKLLAMIGVFGECEITGRASTDKLVLMECRYVRDEAE